MSAGVQVLAGLHGALLLARGRAEGVQYVSDDLHMARRSFCAALLCAPLFLGILGVDWMRAGIPANAAHSIVLSLLSFVISWAGYAVLSHPLVATLGRARYWPRFIAIWNWCNVVQYALLFIASLPAVLGAPPWLDQTAQLVGQGWALWLEWFAIRQALGVSGLLAVLVMAPDILLGMALATAVAGVG